MSRYHPFLILTCMLCKTVVAQVSIAPDVLYPVDGQDVKLTCNLTTFTLLASWINNATGGILTSCPASSPCTITTAGRYSFSATASTIEARISKYNATIDNFGWKCRYNTTSDVFIFTTATTTTSTTSSTSNDLLYLLFLLLLLIPLIVICWKICCKKRKEKGDEKDDEKENLRVSIDIGEELLRKRGNDVKTICSNIGSGNINIVWIGPQRERLTTSGKCTIAEYDGKTKKSSLTIVTSSITDGECYICRAWKKSGASAEAYIKFKKHDKDLFTVGIDEVKCSVPVSASAEWLGPKMNMLTDAEKYNIVSCDSKTKESSLTIKNISANDSGSYTCQAANSSQFSAKNSITITAENPNTNKESENPTVQRVNRVQIIHDKESGKSRSGKSVIV